MATPPSVLEMPAHSPTVSGFDRLFNRAVGALASRGWTTGDYVQLSVVGRKSGKRYSTPVNPLEYGARRYLVAPRGWTQWVRNALAAGEVTIKHGQSEQRFGVRLVPAGERAPLLGAYLERYRVTVQRYFSVRAGAELSAFEAIADQHPVFELQPRA